MLTTEQHYAMYRAWINLPAWAPTCWDNMVLAIIRSLESLVDWNTYDA